MPSPSCISAAAADRELSDEDLDKVSGGANSDGAVRPRNPTPPARAM